MADEGDSKSLVLITRVGSTPTTGTKKQLEIERFLAAFLFNTLLLILLCSRGKCWRWHWQRTLCWRNPDVYKYCLLCWCRCDRATPESLSGSRHWHRTDWHNYGEDRESGYASSGVRLENLGNADSESRAESAFPSGLHRPNGDTKFVRKGLLCVIIQSAEFCQSFPKHSLTTFPYY